MNRTVKNSMSSNLIYAHWNESAGSAYLKMHRNKIRHLPVLDSSGIVTGIVSERDLRRALKSTKTETNCVPSDLDFEPFVKVEELMSWPVKAVDEQTPISEVANKMISEKVSAYLVTKNEKIVGIVTHEDLLQLLVRMASGFEIGDFVPGMNFRISASIRKGLDHLSNLISA